jgi:hypothetical protein
VGKYTGGQVCRWENSHFKVEPLQKKAKIFSGIRICRIARIEAFSFLIRAIRKIRIPKKLFPVWLRP